MIQSFFTYGLKSSATEDQDPLANVPDQDFTRWAPLFERHFRSKRQRFHFPWRPGDGDYRINLRTDDDENLKERLPRLLKLAARRFNVRTKASSHWDRPHRFLNDGSTAEKRGLNYLMMTAAGRWGYLQRYAVAFAAKFLPPQKVGYAFVKFGPLEILYWGERHTCDAHSWTVVKVSDRACFDSSAQSDLTYIDVLRLQEPQLLEPHK